MPDTGRRVELEGAVNFRDLGGLPAADGAVVRRGVLYRSDSLHRLTPADLDRLHDEVGVRTVIDLRMTEEQDEHGPRPGHYRDHVTVLHRPLFTEVRPEWVHETSWTFPEDRALRYLEFLEAGPGEVVQVIRALGDPTRTPAVMHCHSGRDRTGIVAGIVLDLLGVDRRIIGDDYAVSSRYITDFELTPERMIRLLEMVDERYGSVEAMLRPHGLTDDDLDALRSGMLGG